MSCLSADSAAGSTCSSSSGSKLPWLHLLGHCFLQWSVERQRIGVEAEGPEEQRVSTTDHSLGAGVSAAAASAVCATTANSEIHSSSTRGYKA